MFEDVKPGDPIPKLAAFWNGLKAAVRARRLLPGVGVRLREMPFGTIVHFDSAAALWDHPWRVSLAENEATLRRGLIDGMEPKIGQRLMSGDEKNPEPPKLRIAPGKFTADGISLICVEIECTEYWKTKSATIVQAARLNDGEVASTAAGAGDEETMPLLPPALPGRKTRYPLVLLRRRKGGSIEAFQIAYFHFQHVAIFPAGVGNDDALRVRHFFFPG
jgi:hypothetical protein